MPNYEYRCTSCENQFELWQEVGSSAPPCPDCGAEVKKVFHPIRTIYKGSGFYVTDLRAEKEKAKTPAKTEAKSEAAKSETAVESKSDATSESKAPASAPASTPSVDASAKA